jgi:hypothetical protein
MSQIVRAIAAIDTGQRKVFDEKKFTPLFQDVFESKMQVSEVRDIEFTTAKLFKIGVTLGQSTMVTELEQLGSDDALSEAIYRTKRSVIEAIFGEFREDFMRIQNALYDRDFQKARTLLVAFENKMFEV